MCIHDDYYDRNDSDVEEIDARMFYGDTPELDDVDDYYSDHDDVGHTDDEFDGIKFIGATAGPNCVDHYDDLDDEEFNDVRFRMPGRKQVCTLKQNLWENVLCRNI